VAACFGGNDAADEIVTGEAVEDGHSKVPVKMGAVPVMVVERVV
jgi:hypothetical protein